MRRNALMLGALVLASCGGGCPNVCVRDPDPNDVEYLHAKRLGPCKYEYSKPLSWWRGGYLWVQVNGLPVDTLDLDEEHRVVSFPCTSKYRDAGEPTDVVILYDHN